MKTTLVLLTVAVVAISNAAVLNGPERFSLETGSIGPDDSKLTTIESQYFPTDGTTLLWSESGFSMPTVKLTIAYVKIVELTNSGAKAEIVSGGVGADHLTVRYTPYDNRGFHFKTEAYGQYTTNARSGAVPEMITFEKKHTLAQ